MSEPSEDTVRQPQQLLPGELVDKRYRIEAYLGGGGMAAIYRAKHVVLEEPVAVKVIRPQLRQVPGVVERFLREARAAIRLRNEHVVRVYDVGTLADGAPYIVMECLDGNDLGSLLETGWRATVEEAVDGVLQVCEALAEVHGRGIVHRDLKPSNLFQTRGPDGELCIKLIDFGISRMDAPLKPGQAGEAATTEPEELLGSPAYMSPELMESSRADVRSDIWALGAVLYELLVGDVPYDGDSMLDIYSAAVHGPPPAPSTSRHDVPAGLDEVILGCLRTKLEERFSDVSELASALVPFGGESAAHRAATIARTLATARKRRDPSAAPRASTARAPRASAKAAASAAQRSLRRTVSASRAKPIALGIAAAVALTALVASGRAVVVARDVETRGAGPSEPTPRGTASAVRPSGGRISASAPAPSTPPPRKEPEDDDATATTSHRKDTARAASPRWTKAAPSADERSPPDDKLFEDRQ